LAFRKRLPQRSAQSILIDRVDVRWRH
jgi:hypothetical protein